MPYLGRRSTTRGKCRALFCHLAVGQPLMPSCLGCSVVLLPWCRTAADFGRGGGAILRGVKRPQECKLFGTVCTPENPIGSCMVSSEGACAAHYTYGRYKDV